MIKITEIREKSDAGSTEFSAKEVSSAEAIKILVSQELGLGAIVAEVTETKLITIAKNTDNSWDEVIFEGTGPEFQPLLEQVYYFTTAWSNNQQLIDSLCVGKLSQKSSKTFPLACAFIAPVSCVNPPSMQILLGKGMRPKQRDSDRPIKPAKIDKDGTARFRAAFRIATPLADC